jgi:signal transduction histidine kinase
MRRKRRRIRMTGLSGTLLVFSFVITSFLIVAFILYIKLIPAPRLGLPVYLANLDNNYVISSLEKGSSTIPLSTIIGFIAKNQIENMYLAAMLKDLPYLLIIIIFIFVSGAVVLSKILQRQREKQALLLARKLSRIDDRSGMEPEHPAITKAYSEIKNRLAANALDYMRLSSYVTHEQKNMLSLLRAKLQLSGNSELTKDVDKVVSSLDDILILSASANSSGKMEIIDAALVCADVCDEYKKIYPNIYFDFDDSANYQVVAKELWINRAVSNLVNNAMKHGKGRIGVSVSPQDSNNSIYYPMLI